MQMRHDTLEAASQRKKLWKLQIETMHIDVARCIASISMQLQMQKKYCAQLHKKSNGTLYVWHNLRSQHPALSCTKRATVLYIWHHAHNQHRGPPGVVQNCDTLRLAGAHKGVVHMALVSQVS